jgi:membrane-associated phospholipid phosphatase
MSGPPSPLATAAARALSVFGHPALLMPLALALALAARGAAVPARLLWVALGTAAAVTLIVGAFSLWQVHGGRWTHVDASRPDERRQLNRFLLLLLCNAAAVLWALGQPQAVAAGPLLVALVVLLAHLLRRRLKVSLHAAFVLFAVALVWPAWPATALLALLAAGVAWSRRALGRHTRAEVLVGLLLGAAVGAGGQVWAW